MSTTTPTRFPKLTSSMMIVGAITFVGDSSRGVLFPVLWGLCQNLKGSVVDLGYLVATFSIGRLIVTTPLGYLSDKYKQKLPLIIASITLSFGALLWSNTYLTSSIVSLYISQLILGFGSGSLGVTRSYVVEKSSPKVRTEMLALMTSLQYAGFTVSPILGSLLGFAGQHINSYWSYALPGYSIFIMSFYCVIALLCLFDNHSDDNDDHLPTYNTQLDVERAIPTTSTVLSDIHSTTYLLRTTSICTTDDNDDPSRRNSYPRSIRTPTMDIEKDDNMNKDVCISALPSLDIGDREINDNRDTMMITNPIHSLNDTNISLELNRLESNIKSDIDTNIDKSPHRVRFEDISIATTTTTIVHTSPRQQTDTTIHTTPTSSPQSTYTIMNIWSKMSSLYTQMNVSTFCIVAMILLNVTTKGSISVYETLGAQMGQLDYNMSVFQVGILVTSCGLFGFIQLLLFKSFWKKYFSDMFLMLGGIGVMICAQLIIMKPGRTPSFGHFLVSFILMYAIGYPIGHTAVLGAFSKIQKNGPQGALMGWFATAGSVARIIIPITTGYMDRTYDNSPFILVLSLLTLSYVSLLFLKPILLPLIDPDSIHGSSYLNINPMRRNNTYPNTDSTNRHTSTTESTGNTTAPLHLSIYQIWSTLKRYEKFQVIIISLLFLASLCLLILLPITDTNGSLPNVRRHHLLYEDPDDAKWDTDTQ